MSGNVWEWVNDWYQRDYYSVSPYSNPPGRSTGTERLVRGGSWLKGRGRARVAARYVAHRSVRYMAGGFRCSMSPEEPTSLNVTVAEAEPSASPAGPQGRIAFSPGQHEDFNTWQFVHSARGSWFIVTCSIAFPNDLNPANNVYTERLP